MTGDIDELYAAYLRAYAKASSGGTLDDMDHRSTDSQGLWDTPQIGCVVAMAAEDVKKGESPRSRAIVRTELAKMMAD